MAMVKSLKALLNFLYRENPAILTTNNKIVYTIKNVFIKDIGRN